MTAKLKRKLKIARHKRYIKRLRTRAKQARSAAKVSA